jgi:hypothetical protein
MKRELRRAKEEEFLKQRAQRESIKEAASSSSSPNPDTLRNMLETLKNGKK